MPLEVSLCVGQYWQTYGKELFRVWWLWEVILSSYCDLKVFLKKLKYDLSLHYPIISIFFLVPSEVTFETLPFSQLKICSYIDVSVWSVDTHELCTGEFLFLFLQRLWEVHIRSLYFWVNCQNRWFIQVVISLSLLIFWMSIKKNNNISIKFLTASHYH